MNKSKKIILIILIILTIVFLVSWINTINATEIVQNVANKSSNSTKNEAKINGLADKDKLIKIGDLNADTYINIQDATIVLNYCAQLASGMDISDYDYAKKFLDVNGDGHIRVDDATIILSYYSSSAAGLFDDKEYDIQEFVKEQILKNNTNE